MHARFAASGSKRAVDFAIQTVDFALARQRYYFHLTLVARLEANGRAGGNVEPETPRRRAIKPKRVVNLKEMKMAADLDRTIAGIRHEQTFRFEANIRVQGKSVFLGNDFTWDHDYYRIG
jgi:hypothetical protein